MWFHHFIKLVPKITKNVTKIVIVNEDNIAIIERRHESVKNRKRSLNQPSNIRNLNNN